jgi:bifunctional N-acetylglucosamine-1-phosphate-uridyltransferase/glucosamine-1-phosphate-acetyltransferase GlmU-like protein
LSRQSKLAQAQPPAHSVITKNVPEGGLAVARGKQVTIADWKRPTKK